jgi:hypothetical protein
MVSGAFSQNALRSQGQLGSCMKQATFCVCFFDAILKYNGWSATAAYMSRMADNPITVSATDATKQQAVL